MTVNRNITMSELRAMVTDGRVTPFEYDAIMIKVNGWRQAANRRNPTPHETSWTHMPSNGRAIRKSHATKMRDHWRGSNGRQTFYADDSRAVAHTTLGRYLPNNR